LLLPPNTLFEARVVETGGSRNDRDVARPREQWPDMAQEGVVRSPGRQPTRGSSEVASVPRVSATSSVEAL
jgi:hypothetical protein